MSRNGRKFRDGLLGLACGLACACVGSSDDEGEGDADATSGVCDDWCAQLDALACPARDTALGTCRMLCQDDFASHDPVCRPLVDDYTACILDRSSFECGAATGDVFIGTPSGACDSEKQALADAGCPQRTLVAGG